MSDRWFSQSGERAEQRLADVLAFVRSNTESALYHQTPPCTLASLETILPSNRDMLRNFEGSIIHYPEREIRYLVSEFYEKDADRLFLFAQRVDTVWNAIDEELRRHDPIVAVLSVPLFWQMGPMMYRATQYNKIPISVLSPRNVPLARQVIREVGAQFVATTPATARDLQAILESEDAGDQIQSWHLIAPVGENPLIPTLPGRVVLEHHLFPGVPLGVTTPEMMQRKEAGFIPSDEFLFEIEPSGQGYVTSMEKTAVPLLRYQLPGTARVVTNADGVACVQVSV